MSLVDVGTSCLLFAGLPSGPQTASLVTRVLEQPQLRKVLPGKVCCAPCCEHVCGQVQKMVDAENVVVRFPYSACGGLRGVGTSSATPEATSLLVPVYSGIDK